MEEATTHRAARPAFRVGIAALLINLLAGALFALAGFDASGVGVALAASPANAAAAPAAGATTLRIGWTSAPDSLNPFVGCQSSCAEIWALNYDQLTSYNAKLQVTPQLAKSWSKSADGLVWTFKIRQGVKWQDGRPLTSRDVAFTYNYIIKNGLAAFASYTRGIVKAVAPDNATVVFTTSKPKADMLGLGVPIVPAHIWAGIPAKQATSSFLNSPSLFGSGPFRVVEWHKNNFIRLEANPRYWGQKPHFDEILFITYQNTNTMTLDFKAGKLDGIWGISEAQYKQLKATPGVQATSYFTFGFDQLTFNCDAQKSALGNPVLRDAKFRQALNWAIDKQKIVDLSYGGQARPANSLIPAQMYSPALDFHWTPTTANAYSFNLKKAGRLLTAAGYPLKNGVRVNKHGKPITLGLYARSESRRSQSAGKFIAGWFDKLGIKVDLQVISEAVLSDRIWNTDNGKRRPDYDMFLWGWVGNVDPNFLLSISATGQIGSANQSNFSNAAYDRLFAAQQQQLDPRRRKQIVWQMERILYQQTPFVPLIYMQNLEAWSTSRWRGWSTWPTRHGGAFCTHQRSSYMGLRPVNKLKTRSRDVIKPGLIAGAAAAVLVATAAVVIAGAAWLLLRQRPRGEKH